MAETSTLDHVQTIDHLDFDPQCEAKACEAPATLLVRYSRPCHESSKLGCEPCYQITVERFARRCGEVLIHECGRVFVATPDLLSAEPLGGDRS